MKNLKKIMTPIAVTIGEPSGIGPEVTLKAWNKRSENNLNPFFVIGSAIILKKQAENFGLNIPISIITSPHQALTLFKK
jgi:4-hydroxythreonine-4-phosphate dehydrogenase